MKKQTCCTCKLEKDSTCFAFKNKAKQILQGQCKSCKIIYNKSWYENNKEEHKKHAVINKKKYSLENITFVMEYYKTHPCVDCGESDPVCLDFDHVSGEKLANISTMIVTYNLKSLIKEIEKCQVRCANCHRRKTSKEQNWYHRYYASL
jgi:hypothetical protein